MIKREGILVKEREDHCIHFIKRLFDRYQLIITELEYGVLCKQFHGIFKKSSNKTIGFVFIQGIKVWCLYAHKEKWLTTAYPPDIEHDNNELIKSCFGRLIRPLAYMVYESYLQEAAGVRMDFQTDKDAAIYFFSETLFPSCHIDQFKYGSVRPFKIMGQIKHVLFNDSKYIRLTLQKIQQTIQ